MRAFLRWLQLWSFRISKNYAVDIMLLHKFSQFSDGVTVLDCDINLDLYEADHNPKFELRLAFLNVYIFQLEIYNINHKD